MRSILLAATALLCAAISPGSAARRYVDCAATGTVHDGSSWTNACLTLTAAINTSAFGDTIWVKSGVYHETPILIKDTILYVYGGFLGFETKPEDRIMSMAYTVTSTSGSFQAGQMAFPSVIDADGQGSVVTVQKSLTYQLTPSCIIDGFTLRNGYGENGGGVNVLTNTVTILNNSRVESCEATGMGGGVYLGRYANTATVPSSTNDCIIVNNKALYGGGAVVDYHCTGELRRTLIIRNTATGDGGGMYCPFHCDGRMYNCTVAYNSAAVTSGAAYVNYGGNVQYFNSIFAFNTAPVSGGLGGGNGANSLTYTYCDLYGNQVGDWGGNIPPPSSFAGNYVADPRFLAPDYEEFHLAATSPCSNAGMYALETPYRISRINVAKQLPVGTAVHLFGKVVTAVDGLTVYVEEPDRTTSIPVTGISAYSPGTVLKDLTGTVTTDGSGNKILTAATATAQAGYIYPMRPYGVCIQSVATLTGSLAKVWGRAQNVSAGGFTLTDGRSNLSVVGSNSASEGDFVAVTGVYTLNGEFRANSILKY